MRHRKEGKKFNRIAGRRRSFVRNLVNDFFRHGRIETTETRAKAIRPMVERSISLAKKQDLASRRLLLSRLQSKTVVERLMSEIGPRYKERAGGYTRIVKGGKTRKRDGSRLAVIEYVQT
jgi:large subunit ribosomal protein L17